jgi:hypothetical protein
VNALPIEADMVRIVSTFFSDLVGLTARKAGVLEL